MCKVNDVKMLKNVLQLASGNFDMFEQLIIENYDNTIFEETKAILTIMNEGIKRKRSKEPINVYAIEESCQILAQVFRKRQVRLISILLFILA